MSTSNVDIEEGVVSTKPCLTLKERLNFREIAKIIVVFLVWFCFGLFYVSFTDLISSWRSILFSTVFGTFFAVGFATSHHFRCAMFVFLVQCFSPFGIFMVFVQTSWLTSMQMLEKVVIFHKNVESPECHILGLQSRALMDDDNIFNYKLMENILVVLHYAALVPVLCIFVYSFLFELTYKDRVQKKGQRRNDAGGKHEKSTLDIIVEFCTHLMSFFVGVILSTTITIAISDGFLYSIASVLVTDKMCRKKILPDSDFAMLTFYLIFCVLLLVLVPFSSYILKLRGVIIRQFFKEGDPLQSLEKNIRFIKDRQNTDMDPKIVIEGLQGPSVTSRINTTNRSIKPRDQQASCISTRDPQARSAVNRTQSSTGRCIEEEENYYGENAY